MSRELLRRCFLHLRNIEYANDSAIERLNALLDDIETELTKTKPEPEPLTDGEILKLWAGSDIVRPVLGKNKVLRFAREIEQKVRGEK